MLDSRTDAEVVDVVDPARNAVRRGLRTAASNTHLIGPAAAAAVIGGWALTRPSLWRDEIITWSAATRSLSSLARTVNDVDAVFIPYYLFMHVWTAVFGDSELALRLPSLLAMIGTAAVIGAIGARVHSPRAGLLAGLVLASLPTVSRLGQEARSYALAALFVAVATLLLLRALERPSRRRWTVYALACTLAGWAHLFAASVLLAHLIAVVAVSRRERDGLWREWLVAAAAAGVAIAPLAVLGAGQQQQVAWLHLTTWSTLPDYLSRLVGVAIVAGIVLGLGLAGFGAGRDRNASWVVGALAVAPFAALFALGLVKPLFHQRYVLFVLVAWAVLAGVTLARAHVAVAVAALAAIVGFSVSTYVLTRTPDGHTDGGLDDAAGYIVSEQRPGDGIVLSPQGWLRLGMDYYLPAGNRPRDVYLVRSAADRGSYTGAECSDHAQCLGAAPRVWVVCFGHPVDPLSCLGAASAAPIRDGYTRGRPEGLGTLTVTLYDKRHS